MILKSVCRTRGIETGSRVRVKLSIFGLPFTMEAEHIALEPPGMFRDRFVKSPFSRWTHTHLFSSLGKDDSILEDRVEYTLFPYLPRFFHRLADREIRRMFEYRHLITAGDMDRHRAASASMTILVSGAGGVIGSALVDFLTTGGHRVIRLVRRLPVGGNELFWDPAKRELDLKDAGYIDAVINLNGNRIFGKRWTGRQKEKIINSRVDSTRTLALALAALSSPPKVFISASATGFYGEGGDRVLNENGPRGDLFISRVCSQWEKAAEPARDAGIRTVFARIGVALTPRGGALASLLPCFRLGLGGKIASGNQYMSWISMDDIIYGLYHMINTPLLEGPVNLVSPNPVTNKSFTGSLSRVVGRRAGVTVPEPAINLLWGAMGKEVLLTSTRVVPEKLLNSGFRFSYPDLDEALGFTLGRPVADSFEKDRPHA